VRKFLTQKGGEALALLPKDAVGCPVPGGVHSQAGWGWAA